MKFLLYSHVFAGIISLVVAPVAMIVKKGGSAHRVWGKVFVGMMTWVFISAVILSIFKWIPFLLMIAVFSYYSVFIAYRTLYQKQLHLGKGIRWYDWLALGISLCFNIYFIGYGIYNVVHAQLGMFAWLAIFFGTGGLLQAVGQLRSFIKPPDKYHWLYHHLGNMMGGFIASVTAFSSQVMFFMPGALKWIWPSLFFAPIIAYWSRMYRKKIEAGQPISSLVELKR